MCASLSDRCFPLLLLLPPRRLQPRTGGSPVEPALDDEALLAVPAAGSDWFPTDMRCASSLFHSSTASASVTHYRSIEGDGTQDDRTRSRSHIITTSSEQDACKKFFISFASTFACSLARLGVAVAARRVFMPSRRRASGVAFALKQERATCNPEPEIAEKKATATSPSHRGKTAIDINMS